MAQEYRPGEIVPQSGIYTITRDPAHADMPHEVTVINGRRFPTCRHWKGIRFELAHAVKHVGEMITPRKRTRRRSNRFLIEPEGRAPGRTRSRSRRIPMPARPFRPIG
jgi:hypothetical protein